MKRITHQLIKLLIEKKLSIAFAESMSCGLLTHQLNTVKGTSEVLKGSIVCYNEEVKTGLLRVSDKLIKKHSAESQVVTDALAKNLRRLIKADIHASVTGLAAPGGSETKSKPVGTVFFSLIYKNKVHKMRKQFRGSPLQIKKSTCKEFYIFIYNTLKKM